MKEQTKTSCPLGESWHYQFCPLHAKDKENDSFDICLHQTACQSYKTLLEFNRSQFEVAIKMFKGPSD